MRSSLSFGASKGCCSQSKAGSAPEWKIQIRLTTHRSKSLQELPDTEFNFVATMGCGDECPFVRAKKREDWAIPDPRDFSPEEFRAVRDLIEKQVVALLNDL